MVMTVIHDNTKMPLPRVVLKGTVTIGMRVHGRVAPLSSNAVSVQEVQ